MYCTFYIYNICFFYKPNNLFSPNDKLVEIKPTKSGILYQELYDGIGVNVVKNRYFLREFFFGLVFYYVSANLYKKNKRKYRSFYTNKL